MATYADLVRQMSPKEQNEFYTLHYTAFWINAIARYKANAIRQLRISSEVAAVGGFTLRRVIRLQDAVQSQMAALRKKLQCA